MVFFFHLASSLLELFERATVLLLRQAGHAAGVLSPRPVNYPALAGRLMLETMEVIRFACILERNIALFVWPRGIGIYTPDGSSATLARLLTIEISLDTKEFVRGKLDGRELTASEAVTIIWFDISELSSFLRALLFLSHRTSV